MKALLILLLSTFSFLTETSAQKLTMDKVPAALKGSFADKFPSATAVKWEKEGNEYEVNFKLKKDVFSAKFDQTGKWLETEQEIKITELPMVIQNNIKKDYPGFKIEEACKVESLKNGHSYEAEVQKGMESWELTYSMDGKQINKVMAEND